MWGSGFKAQGARCGDLRFRVGVQGKELYPGYRVTPGFSIQGFTSRASSPPTHDPLSKGAPPGSGFRFQGPGSRVQGPGSRVQGPGSRVQGPGSRVQGSGFKVQGPGFKVQIKNRDRV